MKFTEPASYTVIGVLYQWKPAIITPDYILGAEGAANAADAHNTDTAMSVAFKRLESARPTNVLVFTVIPLFSYL